MVHITREQEKHYSICFERFGPTPKGVDWGKRKDVLLRYQKMLAVILHDRANIIIPRPKILDVGCGYGGLFFYAKEQGIKLDYTGIDIAKNMISYAKKTTSGARFIHGDILDYSQKPVYDYVVCNGILTQKLTAKYKQMDNFTLQLIKKMYSLSRQGIAFNIMTTRVNYKVDNLYYRDPVELFKICFLNISDRIIIDHAYPLYEYTLYLYREKR